MQSNKFQTLKGFAIVWIVISMVLVSVLLMFASGVIDIDKIKKPAEHIVSTVEKDEQVRALNEQSSSDEIEAIEKDINTTNFNDLDQGIDQVDQDLNSL